MACLTILACNNKKDKGMTGSWMAPIPGQESFMDGFTLSPDGTAGSINMATLKYAKWRMSGDLVILEGESAGVRQTGPVTDTFIVRKGSDGVIALVSASGRVMQLTDTATVRRYVNDLAGEQCFTDNKRPGILVQLRCRMKGDSLIGSMSNRIEGKDFNFGKVFALRSGDTLRGKYLFSSEGLESVREIIWHREGNAWVEGTGEITEEGNTARFRDPARISFNGFRLEPGNCTE